MLTRRFEEAVSYACIVHGGHERKTTGAPYAAHLLAVASLVLEHGGDEELAIAALLHDAAEDGGGRGRLADIAARFGRRVALLVEQCSDTFDTPKPAWRPRKEAHLAKIANLPSEAKLIIAADTLHNLRTFVADHRQHGDALFDHFNGEKEGTLWYYRALASLLCEGVPAALSAELTATMDRFEAMARA